MAKLINLWCIFCENYRSHIIVQGTEECRCVSCGNHTYIPLGDIQ